MKTKPIPIPMYSVPEAAVRLGIGVVALRAEIASGRCPARRLGPRGGVLRLTDDDLAAYLEACKTAPDRPAAGRHKVIKARTART